MTCHPVKYRKCFISGKVPDFPDDFEWRTNGRNANDICTLITEDREPSTTGWDDNFLCQRKNKQNIGIRWSQRGPIKDMRCTKIDMPGKPSRYSWNDNYLCVPTNCFYMFEWSTTGPVSGADCLRIEEPNDRYMNGKKFYLCAKSTKTGMFEIASCGCYEDYTRTMNYA